MLPAVMEALLVTYHALTAYTVLATLWTLFGIFYVVWSPMRLEGSGKPEPLFGLESNGEKGFYNVLLLARRFLESLFQSIAFVIVFPVTALVAVGMVLWSNRRLVISIVIITALFQVYHRNDAEVKLMMDNTYAAHLYPIVREYVKPAIKAVEPFASLALVWWNAVYDAQRVVRSQIIGIMVTETLKGNISWRTTIEYFSGALASVAKTVGRVCLGGIIYADLDVGEIVYYLTHFVHSLTDKTGALCRDINYALEIAVDPLIFPELQYAVTDLANATWMVPAITARWALSTLNLVLTNPSGIRPPNFVSVFNQSSTGLDHAGLWVDRTLASIIDDFGSIVANQNVSVTLPPVGVATGKLFVVAVRVVSFVSHGSINAPFWFWSPSDTDPLNGYLPREMLGITTVPAGVPSLLEQFLSSADEFGASLGDVVGFFYPAAGRVVANAERITTDLVRFLMQLTAKIVLAARGGANFAAWLFSYEYDPIRSHLQELVAAAVDLLTPYYEPAGNVLFSGMQAIQDLSWVLYRIVLNIALLETKEGAAYFKSPLASSPPGFQDEFETALRDLDAFAGTVGGFVTSFYRFTPYAKLGYDAKKRMPMGAVTPSAPSMRVWTLASASPRARDGVACSDLDIVCNQACNDWCATTNEPCNVVDPWPITQGRSECLFGTRDGSTGATIAPGCLSTCASGCNFTKSRCLTDACNLVFVSSCIGQARAAALAVGVSTGCGSAPNLAETRCSDGNPLCCFGGLIASVGRTPVGILRWFVRTCYAIGTLNRSLPSINLILNPVRDWIGYVLCIFAKIYVLIAHPGHAYYVPVGFCPLSILTCVVADAFDTVLGILANVDNLFDASTGGANGYFPDTVVRVMLPNLYKDVMSLFTCATSTIRSGYNPLNSITSGVANLVVAAIGFGVNLFQFTVSIGIEIYQAAHYPQPGLSDADRFFTFMSRLSNGSATDLYDLKSSAQDVVAALSSILIGVYEPASLTLFDGLNTVTLSAWWLVQCLANLPGLFGGNRWNAYYTQPTGFLYDMDMVFSSADATMQSVGGLISGIDGLVYQLGGTVPFKKRAHSEATDKPTRGVIGPTPLQRFAKYRIWKPSVFQDLYQPEWSFPGTILHQHPSLRLYSTAPPLFLTTTFDDSVCALVCNSVCSTSYQENVTYGYENADIHACFTLTESYVQILPDGSVQEVYGLQGGCYSTCVHDCKPGCSACSSTSCDELCALSCATTANSLAIEGNLRVECGNPDYNAAQVLCSSNLLCCMGGTIGSVLRIWVGVIRYVTTAFLAPVLPAGHNLPAMEWFLNPVAETVSYAECTIGRIYQIALVALLHPLGADVDGKAYLPPLACLMPSTRCVVEDSLLFAQDLLLNASKVFSDSEPGAPHFFKLAFLGVDDSVGGVESYQVRYYDTSYRQLLASSDGVCECVGSIFTDIYPPLDAVVSSALKAVISFPRIVIRVVTEFVQRTPSGSLREFFVAYDLDGLGADFDAVWLSLGEVAEDIYHPFQVVVRYLGLSVDTMASIVYNTVLNSDVLPGAGGYYETELVGPSRPRYDPGMLFRLESYFRNALYGIKLVLVGIWEPLAQFVFDVASWLVSLTGFALRCFLQFGLNTLDFPEYLKFTDYDQAFLYADKVAVSGGNLFAPIHPCVPNIVTAVVRTGVIYTTVTTDILTFAPTLLAKPRNSDFVGRILGNATLATRQFEKIGGSIAVMLQHFGSNVGHPDCSAPIEQTGSGTPPGGGVYDYDPYEPSTAGPTSPPVDDRRYSTSTDPSCLGCCTANCISGQDDFVTTGVAQADAAKYFTDLLDTITTLCGTDCECICKNPCASSYSSNINAAPSPDNGIYVYMTNVQLVTASGGFGQQVAVTLEARYSDGSTCQLTRGTSSDGLTRAGTRGPSSSEKSLLGQYSSVSYIVATFPDRYQCNSTDLITMSLSSMTADCYLPQYDSKGKLVSYADESFEGTVTAWWQNDFGRRKRDVSSLPEDGLTSVPHIARENRHRRYQQPREKGIETVLESIAARMLLRRQEYRSARDAGAPHKPKTYNGRIPRSMFPPRDARVDVLRGEEPGKRDGAPVYHFMCDRQDIYSCSGCVPVPEGNVTFNGYATLADCRKDCEGSAGTYPLCTPENTIPSGAYNQPPTVLLKCGDPSASTVFCCGGLLVSGGFSVVGSTLRFGLNVCAAISESTFEMPQLTEFIAADRIFVEGIACVLSFPFFWSPTVQVATANLVYYVLNLNTIPFIFINDSISIFNHLTASMSGIGDLEDLVGQFVDPITDVLIAFVQWLQACGIILPDLGTLMVDVVNLLHSLLTYIGGGVLKMIQAVMQFIVSIFALFSRKGNGDSVVNAFANLINVTFADVIGGILRGLANVLLGGLWDTIESKLKDIMHFFENFLSCFKSASAFGKCIKKILHLKRSATTGGSDGVSPSFSFDSHMRCVTCNPSDETSTAARYARNAGLLFEDKPPSISLKRRAKAVRPKYFFPTAKMSDTSRFSFYTARGENESGGTGMMPGDGFRRRLTGEFSPFGAIFPDELPSDYTFFMEMSAKDPGFAKAVKDHWPVKGGPSVMCDSVVCVAAENGMDSLTPVERDAYTQCVSMFFATRLINDDAVFHNDALNRAISPMLRDADAPAISGAPSLYANEFGDYALDGDPNVYEANYRYTIPDAYFINQIVQKQQDAASRLLSASTPDEQRADVRAEAMRAVLTSPEFFYYQHSEYVPPSERFAQSRERDTSNYEPYVGRFEFYSNRIIITRSENFARDGEDANVQFDPPADPDYDPRFDFVPPHEREERSKTTDLRRDEWDYEYVPKGMLPFADLVSGILDAHGFQDPEVAHATVHTLKKFSPKYYAALLDARFEKLNGLKRHETDESATQEVSWRHVADRFSNVLNVGFNVFRNATIKHADGWVRTAARYAKNTYPKDTKQGEPADRRNEVEDNTRSRENGYESTYRDSNRYADNKYLRKVMRMEDDNASNRTDISARAHSGIGSRERYRTTPSSGGAVQVTGRHMPYKTEPVAHEAERRAYSRHRGGANIPARAWIVEIERARTDIRFDEETHAQLTAASPFYATDDATFSYLMRWRECTTIFDGENASKSEPRTSKESQAVIEDLVEAARVHVAPRSQNGKKTLIAAKALLDRINTAKYPLINAINYLTGDAARASFPEYDEVAKARSAISGGECSKGDGFFGELCTHCALLGGALESYVDLFVITANKTSIIMGGGPIPLDQVFSAEDIKSGRPQSIENIISNSTFHLTVDTGPTQPYRTRPFPKPHDWNFVDLALSGFQWFASFATTNAHVIETKIRDFFTNQDPGSTGSFLFYLKLCFVCDRAALECKNPHGIALGLLPAVAVVTGAIVILLVLSYVILPETTGCLTLGSALASYSLVMMLAYSVTPFCFVRVPECLASDIAGYINEIPEIIPWPPYTKNYYDTPTGIAVPYPGTPTGRAPPSGISYEFVSCPRDRGFVTEWDELAFVADWVSGNFVAATEKIENEYVDPIFYTNRTLNWHYDKFNVTGGPESIDVWCFVESLPLLYPYVGVGLIGAALTSVLLISAVRFVFQCLRGISLALEIGVETISTLHGDYSPNVVNDYREYSGYTRDWSSSDESKKKR